MPSESKEGVRGGIEESTFELEAIVPKCSGCFEVYGQSGKEFSGGSGIY